MVVVDGHLSSGLRSGTTVQGYALRFGVTDLGVQGGPVLVEVHVDGEARLVGPCDLAATGPHVESTVVLPALPERATVVVLDAATGASLATSTLTLR